jgi:hypothetical protein
MSTYNLNVNTRPTPGRSRETSPAVSLAGIANLTVSGAMKEDSVLHKERILAMSIASGTARSILELVDCSPIVYRAPVRKVLTELTRTAKTLSAAQEALLKLQSFKDRGHLPPFLTSYAKAPSYDLTSLSPTQGAALHVELQRKAKQAAQGLLDEMISKRDEEVTRLAKLVTYDTYRKSVEEALNATYATHLKLSGLRPGMSDLTEPMKSIRAEFEAFFLVAPMLCKRCVELALASAMQRSDIWARKVQVLQDTEERIRVDPPELTRKTVNQMINEALKVLPVGERSDRLEKRKKGPAQKSGRLEGAKRQRRETDPSQETEARSGEYTPAHEETSGPWYQNTRSVETIKKLISESNWVWNQPGTWPDELVELPFMESYKCILSRVPIEVLDYYQSRGYIHVHKGVVLPRSVMHTISSGKKFLLPIRYDASLVEPAWEDFSRRLKWKYYFSEQGENAPFDRDYWTPKRETALPPPVTDVIESGLDTGKASLVNQLVKPTQTPFSRTLLEMEQTRQWLLNEEVIVLPSDKNLGYVLVKCEWYTNQLRSFIITPSFRALELGEAKNFGWETLSILHRLHEKLDAAFRGIEEAPVKQMKEFLLSSSERGSSMDFVESPEWIPVMSGIPKLKNWRLRPIIPATTHGWLLGPLAKILSKLLKPAIRKVTTLCESSGQLAEQLSRLRLPEGRRIVMATADIESFYTNVPIEDTRWLESFLQDHTPEFKEWFTTALKLVNERLLVWFGNHVYLQTKGLAMGVGSSPDVANLYVAEYETVFSQSPEVLFFKRYMDDVFVILDLEEGEDARHVCDRLSYPNLTLKWATSESSVVFLDMNIWINKPENRVEFSPYSKPLNHYERIPWDSAHPVWMKRGGYMGELSRLASISSSRRIFVDAISRLMTLYAQRGYPVYLINQWTKAKADEKWVSRYDSKYVDMSPLIIKSVLNPVWEGINMTTVFNSMKRVWGDLHTPEVLGDRLILSRRKPYWLGLDTLTRLWNETVMDGVQTDALSVLLQEQAFVLSSGR